MASNPTDLDTRSEEAGKPMFRTVKLFDLGLAPAFIQDAIRPIAFVHLSKIDGCAIWEVTVGLVTGKTRRRKGLAPLASRKRGGRKERMFLTAVGRRT